MATDKKDRRFQFLLEQFKLHSQRLNNFHSERSKITNWSTLAIFGYFGWFLTNTTKFPVYLVAALPVVFVLLGFAYVHRLHKIIDRHGAFLDHLENEMFHCGAESEWQKFKSKGHHGKPIRSWHYTYWWVLVIGTIFLSGWLASHPDLSVVAQ